jgi:hypothetical protein
MQTSTPLQPIPRNLREQMVKQLSNMPEEQVVELYELFLLSEKLKIRRELSDQASKENESGLWRNLPEIIRAYRASKKSA